MLAVEAAPATAPIQRFAPEALAELPEPAPATVAPASHRRLARGTEAEHAVNEWHDDEPTRGRRSAPRMFVARYAA